jgi:hypothetical protein
VWKYGIRHPFYNFIILLTILTLRFGMPELLNMGSPEKLTNFTESQSISPE